MSQSQGDGKMRTIDRLRGWARQLKRELFALYFAYRDRRVSWPARIFAACVVGYAFSPIDLIPDFIPILGYLDDLLLVPLGIAIAVRLIPPAVLAECRQRATEMARKPTNWWAAAFIITIWLLLALLAGWWLLKPRLVVAE